MRQVPTPKQGRGRGVRVLRTTPGRKKLVSQVPKEEQKRRFQQLEEAKIAELARVGTEKATHRLSDKVVSSSTGAPIHRGAAETREGAQPLSPTMDLKGRIHPAHPVIFESHAERFAKMQAAAVEKAQAEKAPIIIPTLPPKGPSVVDAHEP